MGFLFIYLINFAQSVAWKSLNTQVSRISTNMTPSEYNTLMIYVSVCCCWHIWRQTGLHLCWPKHRCNPDMQPRSRFTLAAHSTDLNCAAWWKCNFNLIIFFLFLQPWLAHLTSYIRSLFLINFHILNDFFDVTAVWTRQRFYMISGSQRVLLIIDSLVLLSKCVISIKRKIFIVGLSQVQESTIHTTGETVVTPQQSPLYGHRFRSH